MRRGVLTILVPLLAPMTALAQERPAAPTPITKQDPTDADLQKLIVQLGSDDYDAREQAARRLRQIGKRALPQLKEALSSPDAEIVNRVRLLITRIEARAVPGPNPNADPFNGAVPNNLIRLSIVNGDKVTQVSENGRDIKIVEGPAGITMTVSGWVEGKPATEQYTAATADELRAENPEAFKLFDQWAGAGMAGPGAFLQPLQIRGGALVVGPPAGPQELDLLRVRLEKQMKENKTAEDARDDVLGALEKAAAARDFGDMDEYLKRADDLHAVLEKQKLDPGELLPPPAKTRLGISIREIGQGVMIQSVADKSRAQRIGLKAGDLIQKVDGQDVNTVSQLRKLVAAKEKGLIVEIRREGEEIKLEEKSPDAKPKE